MAARPLNGSSTKIASARLALAFPDPYGVIDPRTLEGGLREGKEAVHSVGLQEIPRGVAVGVIEPRLAAAGSRFLRLEDAPQVNAIYPAQPFATWLAEEGKKDSEALFFSIEGV
jgi:hypothetical protein